MLYNNLHCVILWQIAYNKCVMFSVVTPANIAKLELKDATSAVSLTGHLTVLGVL